MVRTKISDLSEVEVLDAAREIFRSPRPLKDIAKEFDTTVNVLYRILMMVRSGNQPK